MRAGSPGCDQRRLVLGVGLLLVVGLGGGCRTGTDTEREAERETRRIERARQARARRARDEFRRRWHDQYRRDIARATGKQTAPAPPPRACDPWTEFHRRVRGSHHLGAFTEAVHLLLRPTAAGAVELDGRPQQRFTFALRMHPAEEPDLGRKPARDVLELDLRWVPLCPQGPMVVRTETLQLRLLRRPPRGRMGLRLRLPGPAGHGLAPGEPVELLLDPTVPTLAGRRGRPRGTASPASAPQGTGPVGLWEITDARAPDRPRTKRLALDTSAFGERLRQVSAVEVACTAPGGQCRFLTRTDGYRETALALGALLRQAAPIARRREAHQLWTVVRALKYARCSAGEAGRGGQTHPCLRPGGPGATEPCQYWRALNGYPTRLQLQGVGQSFTAAQVLSCPGARHRVLRVEATFSRNGDFRLRETDLAARADDLDAALQKMNR